MKFRKLRRTVPNRVTETFLSELHKFHITYSHNNLYKKHYSRCDNNKIVVFNCCFFLFIITILIFYICTMLNIQNTQAVFIFVILSLILSALALPTRVHLIYMCNRNIYNKFYNHILNGLKYEQTNDIELRKAMFYKLCNKYQIDTHKVNIKTIIDILKSYNQRNKYNYYFSSTTLSTLFIGIVLVIITLGLNIYIFNTHETKIITKFTTAIIYIIALYFTIKYSRIIESFNELLNSKHHVTLEMLESILINDMTTQQENDIK